MESSSGLTGKFYVVDLAGTMKPIFLLQKPTPGSTIDRLPRLVLITHCCNLGEDNHLKMYRCLLVCDPNQIESIPHGQIFKTNIPHGKTKNHNPTGYSLVDNVHEAEILYSIDGKGLVELPTEEEKNGNLDCLNGCDKKLDNALIDSILARISTIQNNHSIDLKLLDYLREKLQRKRRPSLFKSLFKCTIL